ncbi:type I-F CRISPR-associated helicase Cas3f [Candidatus Enterovibrio escicola]|uniref:type I-F CRISPR-associated helicase Cas3f n=1 Tax=Candidatus Enterovibrio escicola TaxID=1927127 RepID=UPI001237A0C0|nr:type I-F CRISPR-associated helicase Cas3f [Candidatus Enterovibrio escacola]
MNILIISECSKQALPETRRVLDQFAERKGQQTWQIPITYQGLKTLRILLKKTARRNTAVACYRTYGKNRTELMWIVGSRKRFNEDGTVPTNTTRRNILRSGDENDRHSTHTTAVMAGIAGLFHDLGKANLLFQNKLLGIGKHYEPYRHEWVSAQLFLAFVDGRNDQEWLEHLNTLNTTADQSLLANFSPTNIVPFASMAPLAACIVWLIVSHHRLPKCLSDRQQDMHNVASWFNTGISADWNALNHDAFGDKEKTDVFLFPMGTPLASFTWRNKAKELAARALKLNSLHEFAKLELAYPLHLARMALMLADHAYSAGAPTTHWQDTKYAVIANTDRQTRQPKQKLDEHCIGVAHNAYLLAAIIPKLRGVMPAITRHPSLKKRTTDPRFRWQNHAYDRAVSVRKQTQSQGFFGVNMASTGKGKTFANAQIMYGLSDPQMGCRFSVALGLRTLTLQTGDALQERLQLDDDDLAVVIGSNEVKTLHNNKKRRDRNVIKSALADEEKASPTGSESENMFAEHLYVKYDGELDNHYLNRWLKNDKNTRKFVHALISAPISVSTIDHIIPVSEGTSGGQQIAPMLRLLTSDLVLDEPDDFGIEDIPALSRLVYWAGLLGSRLLLSSATLPPSLISNLFDAYRAGRQQFNAVNGERLELPIISYWCDEFNHDSGQHGDVKSYLAQYQAFTEKRQQCLHDKSPALHLGKFLPVVTTPRDAIASLAALFLQTAQQLAGAHYTEEENDTENKGKTFSSGIIRMANIEPLVAVGKRLLDMSPNQNTRIHVCFYHSQHPLAVRSEIEDNLDALLKRNPKRPITSLPQVQAVLKQYPEQHHIFVVLATPVAEVGRDHDYDLAIVEPSSMRSIIQLAGRVQRHRQQPPTTPNIYVLTQNYRALKGESIAYCKPGFECNQEYKLIKKEAKQDRWLKLDSHNLTDILDEADLQPISSSPRFIQPPLRKQNKVAGFIALEHSALNFVLRDKAKVWWTQPHAHLFAEIQKQTPFRKSRPTQSYVFRLTPDEVTPTLAQWDPFGLVFQDSGKLEIEPDIALANGVSIWGNIGLTNVMEALGKQFDLSLDKTCQHFATIELGELDHGQKWRYHPVLGIFRGTEVS